MLYERAGLLVQVDRTEEAIAEVEDFLQDKDDSFMPAMRFMLGQLMLIEDRAADAIEHFEVWRSNTEEPGSREFTLMGYAYVQVERWGDAAGVFESALELTGTSNHQLVELLAYVYTRLGRNEDALGLMEELIAQEPGHERWWRQLASVYLLLDNVPAGTAGMAIANEISDLSFADSRRLAGLLSALNMPSDGAYVLAQGLQDFPESQNFEDQMLLAEMWILAREFDRAVAELRRAATMEQDPEPGLMLAQLYLQREEYAEARTALQGVLELAPEEDLDQAYYLLAVAEINLGNLQEASDALLRIQSESDYAARADPLNQYIDRQLAATAN